MGIDTPSFPESSTNKPGNTSTEGKSLPSARIEGIRFSERTNDIKEQLSGKKFTSPADIALDYPDKDMKKSPMTFNIKEQTIRYGTNGIKISLPMGASIDMVSFEPSNIVVQGSKFGISKKGVLEYQSFIRGIDEVLINKKTTIPSENGDIQLSIA